MPRAHFDIVALVTSAGGLEALRTVLRDLPQGFVVRSVVRARPRRDGRPLAESEARKQAEEELRRLNPSAVR